jgi:hypothetical protein
MARLADFHRQHRGPQLERLDRCEAKDNQPPPVNKRKGKGERLPFEIEGAQGKASLTSNWRILVSSSLRAGGHLRCSLRRLRGAYWHLH